MQSVTKQVGLNPNDILILDLLLDCRVATLMKDVNIKIYAIIWFKIEVWEQFCSFKLALNS